MKLLFLKSLFDQIGCFSPFFPLCTYNFLHPITSRGKNSCPKKCPKIFISPRFQLMKNMDTKLRLRPGPPQQHQLQQQPPYQRSISSPNYDAQTALRVRRWIESKSVTNVADCRPYLNQEIQQGLALRKTTSMNDRSAPRFWKKMKNSWKRTSKILELSSSTYLLLIFWKKYIALFMFSSSKVGCDFFLNITKFEIFPWNDRNSICVLYGFSGKWKLKHYNHPQ